MPRTSSLSHGTSWSWIALKVWSKRSADFAAGFAAGFFFAVFAAMLQVLRWEFNIVHCDGTAGAGQASLFHLDVRPLDEGPPLVDLRLVVRGKRFGRHLLARGYVLPELAQPLDHNGIGKGLGNSVGKLRDNRPRRAFRRPHPLPERDI